MPAKLIKYRFSASEILELENMKWWDKNFDWIKANAQYFDSFVDLKANQTK